MCVFLTKGAPGFDPPCHVPCPKQKLILQMTIHTVFPFSSSLVKKQIELKSRGVKLMPSKDNNQKTSVCKCLPAHTGPLLVHGQTRSRLPTGSQMMLERVPSTQASAHECSAAANSPRSALCLLLLLPSSCLSLFLPHFPFELQSRGHYCHISLLYFSF